MVKLGRRYLSFYYQMKEASALALASLWAHKMRALLTVLGVVIGVTTVIAMVSIIDGLNTTFASQLSFLGSDTFFIQKEKAVQLGFDPDRHERKDFTKDDAEAIMKRCPAVAVADIYAEAMVSATLGHERTKPIPCGGTNTERFDELFSWYVGEGRMLTAEDIAAARYVCCVGSLVAEILSPEGTIIGRDIKLNGYRFRVVGVFAPKGEIFGQSMDNYILVPYGAYRKAFATGRHSHESAALTVKARSPELLNAAIEQTERVLREQRKVPPEKENDFELYTADTLMQIFNQITGAAFAVMIGISAISLLVGGIGIMNIMLVSVTERTREIGVRKALGARRRDILMQFVAEAVVISVAGGVIGILLGALLGESVNLLTKILADMDLPVPHLPAAIKGWSVALGFLFSLAVGLFFGIYPATKAAKLNPIEALRYE